MGGKVRYLIIHESPQRNAFPIPPHPHLQLHIQIIPQAQPHHTTKSGMHVQHPTVTPGCLRQKNANPILCPHVSACAYGVLAYK